MPPSRLVLAVGCAVGLFAMLSSADGCNGSGPCGDLAGSYANTETVAVQATNVCGAQPTNEVGTVSITGAGPDYQVTFPGIQGPCPATSNDCDLSVHCDITVDNSGGTPIGSTTVSAQWTFTSTGFTGTSTVVEQANSACTWGLEDTATKE